VALEISAHLPGITAAATPVAAVSAALLVRTVRDAAMAGLEMHSRGVVAPRTPALVVRSVEVPAAGARAVGIAIFAVQLASQAIVDLPVVAAAHLGGQSAFIGQRGSPARTIQGFYAQPAHARQLAFAAAVVLAVVTVLLVPRFAFPIAAAITAVLRA